MIEEFEEKIKSKKRYGYCTAKTRKEAKIRKGIKKSALICENLW